MEVRLETTEGTARLAEVWVDGNLLGVMDDCSRPEDPLTPGLLDNVAFRYVTDEGFSWAEAVGGNPAKRRRLERVGKWSYVGFGRVMQIMPVRIDFGLLTMQDANWTNDETLVGKFVRVVIDQLSIIRAVPEDWPEGI